MSFIVRWASFAWIALCGIAHIFSIHAQEIFYKRGRAIVKGICIIIFMAVVVFIPSELGVDILETMQLFAKSFLQIFRMFLLFSTAAVIVVVAAIASVLARSEKSRDS